MSSKIPKTGLADRMRAWMIAQEAALFTSQDICTGLKLPPGKDRDRVRNALGDFLNRGECIVAPAKQKRRQPITPLPRRARYYRYVQGDRPPSAPTPTGCRGIIYKAMRLLSFHEPFTVADLVKYTGQKRNIIDRTVRRLLQEGYLRIDGSCLPASGAGEEELYRVKNMDKFRLEVMK
ncbi:MAG TPA: hypothetical protein VLL97_06965 [Acidobacteriota bacterium]|nr:hypothetical protein [Acidobacteriota bacterium]